MLMSLRLWWWRKMTQEYIPCNHFGTKGEWRFNEFEIPGGSRLMLDSDQGCAILCDADFESGGEDVETAKENRIIVESSRDLFRLARDIAGGNPNARQRAIDLLRDMECRATELKCKHQSATHSQKPE